MKLRLKFWCSSLQPWKLHVKLLTKLVASCSKHQPMYVTNTLAKAKANAATKMLQIIPIASIFHNSDGSNHRTRKDQVLWS